MWRHGGKGEDVHSMQLRPKVAPGPRKYQYKIQRPLANGRSKCRSACLQNVGRVGYPDRSSGGVTPEGASAEGYISIWNSVVFFLLLRSAPRIIAGGAKKSLY